MTKISILQWNVWYKEDIHNIASFLKTYKADIICLQELTIGYQQSEPHTVQYIAKTLDYRHYGQGMTTPGRDWIQANAIFTKFPILNKQYHYINEPIGTNGFDDEYRSYIETTLEVNEKQLTVGTTHMSYTDAFTETQRKAKETDKLIALLNQKKQNYILTGDLNAMPTSSTIQKIKHVLRHVGPSFDQKTWTTKPFSYNGFEADKLDWRLDYAFATQDVRIVSTEIVQTNFSDHLPIKITLEI